MARRDHRHEEKSSNDGNASKLTHSENLVRSESVLLATLESIEDGVLVVSKVGRVSHFNTRFLEIWSIQKDCMENMDDQRLLEHVASQLVDAKSFTNGVQEIYNGTEKTHDTLYFKNGQIIEWFSSPLEFASEEPERMWLFRDVTARTRDEVTIRDREAQFSSILRAVPVGIVIVIDRVFWEINDAMCHISGYERKELLGQSTRFLYPSLAEFKMVSAMYARLETGQQTVEMESRLKRKDGAFIDVLLSAAPLDAGNLSRGVTVAVVDITERKRSETALRDREAQLSSILRAVPVGIGLIANRTILEINEALCRISGYSREECLGRSARFHYLTDEEFEAAGAMYQRLETGEPTVEIPSRWRRKDGFAIDVVLNAAPLDPHDLSRGTTVAVVDVTERKRNDEALRASQAFLSESQRIAHIGSWELDLSTGRLTWTEECFRIYGYSPNSFEPSLTTWFDCILKEDRMHATTHYQETIATKDFKPFEFRIMQPNGTLRWVHVTGVVKCDECGTPIRFVGTQQDITEHRKSEEDRVTLERQTMHTQKLESLGLLAGGFAHDFNNLLTAILANLDMVIVDLPPDTDEQMRLEKARNASLCAADLCNQILAFSGRGSFVIELQNLNFLVQNMTRLLDSSISKKIALSFDLAPDLPMIQADATQLRQIIMNLVVNAADAIGNREGHIHIATRIQQCDLALLSTAWQAEALPEGDYVVLEISDDGSGMDAETLSHIFDPFFTTKTTGRGLGLAAVQGIMRGHKGAIHVYSELSRGTTFKHFFPATFVTSIISKPSPEFSLLLRSSGTVLLVDDEFIVRDVEITILQKLGFKTLTAADGIEALEVYKAHQIEIQLIILDLTMPRMDGTQTFRELRKLNATVPIIIASGYSEQEVGSLFEGSGVNGFIQKPFTRAALCAKMSELLPILPASELPHSSRGYNADDCTCN